jgi:lipoprotein-releasing system permease protein
MVSVTTGLAFLGIMLGVATLVIVLSVMDGFRLELTEKLVSMHGHIRVLASSRAGLREKDADGLGKRFQACGPGILNVTPLVERQAMILRQGVACGAVVYGMSGADLQNRCPPLAEGSWEGFDPDDGIILGHRLARQLFVTVGDTVTLMSPEGEMTGFGTLPRMRSFRVQGLFDAGMYAQDSTVAFAGLEATQAFFNLPGAVTALDIRLQDPGLAPELAARISPLVAAGVRVVDWQRANLSTMAALQVERNVMFLILSLIILIASFNIITGMTFLVRDKAKDIAFLRSIGASRLTIAMIFYRIALIIGLGGVVCGVVLGVVITLNLESLRQVVQSLTGTPLFAPELYYLSQLPAVLKADNVVVVSLWTLGLVVLAGFWPAWRASRTDMLGVLRQG